MDLAGTYMCLPFPSSLLPHSKAVYNSGLQRQKNNMEETMYFLYEKQQNRQGRE